MASAAAEPTREKSQRTEPIDEQAEAPSSKYPPPQPRGKFEPPLKADQPAKTEIKLRDWGIEHNVRNNVLYWSLECMPFVRNTAIEPCFHGHVKALLDALKLDAGTAGRRFFDRMSESGNIAASDDAQYNFWLRYEREWYTPAPRRARPDDKCAARRAEGDTSTPNVTKFK